MVQGFVKKVAQATVNATLDVLAGSVEPCSCAGPLSRTAPPVAGEYTFPCDVLSHDHLNVEVADDGETWLIVHSESNAVKLAPHNAAALRRVLPLG